MTPTLAARVLIFSVKSLWEVVSIADPMFVLSLNE
jgi:hypothetical protein